MNARFAAPMLLGVLILVGCGTNNPPGSADAAGGEHGHDHPSVGPHGGELIELGNEAYHAEMLHDENAGSVTIHVLDSAAVEPVAIEATEVTINVKRSGEGAQYTLTAVPDANDPTGKASRFSLTDPALLADFESGSPAQLVISIAGAQYRGDIEHEHDHDHEGGSEHEHE